MQKEGTKKSIIRKHNFLFTSESVTTGHPDKLCDYVSDSVLDACLKEDPESKVACETATKGNTIMILGEISTTAQCVMEKVVRDAIKEVGYDDCKKGMDYKKACVIVHLDQQSQEIANSVHVDKKIEDIGAGDQGMMLGYASNETKECMPLSHELASLLCMRLRDVREQKLLPWVHPDAKTQVTVEYAQEGQNIKPVRVHTILISTSHSSNVTLEQIKKDTLEHIITPTIPKDLMDDKTVLHINPSGSFTMAGPMADAGLTGRKIIVDTYGGWGGHGGGAFSGKDPTKVDRSAAYAARWVAKSLVKNDLCSRCLVQVAYGIGIAKPISVHIDSYGTVKPYNGVEVDDEFLTMITKSAFDLRPGCIIRDLDLKKPQFKHLAGYGHFGVNAKDYPWEQPKDLKQTCETVMKEILSELDSK